DFTKEAFRQLGMETLFSGVNIKPGKPTTFGKLGECIVINLPGNPLAAMVNFEMLVKPSIAKLTGRKSFYHGLISTKMRQEYRLKAGKNTVILGEWDGESFLPLSNQKPGMISPLEKADGMIVTSTKIDLLEKGQMVKMIPIKFDFSREEKEDFFIS
ncbi:MAG TPA: molybdopterin molybdenumtransferase MoeA, partial [Sulfurovum sp.]|nr:molybdopterin molybdenumtransferase MoeA [Sulfurovum sp.]